VAQVLWTRAARAVLHDLPLREREQIARKTALLRRFPRMYPVMGKGRFRRHRRFQAGDWLVYYRVVGNVVYIRGLWPARIP